MNDQPTPTCLDCGEELVLRYPRHNNSAPYDGFCPECDWGEDRYPNRYRIWQTHMLDQAVKATASLMYSIHGVLDYHQYRYMWE